jgi:carboxyl-terminal processing protease
VEPVIRNPSRVRRVSSCVGFAKVYNYALLLTDFATEESPMKKSPQVISVTFLSVLFIAACGPVTPVSTPRQAPTTTSAPLPTPLSDAGQYLSDALDIIQNNALNSDKVDWPKVRSIAFMYENNARTPADTYDSIRFVLEQLGDHHSAFVTPDIVNQDKNSTIYNYPRPTGKLIENKIGYVAVFEFNAQAEDEMNKHADEIQTIIIELDERSVCGWIVDLRENLGGNMYPMIAGLGALIGDGELGSFKDASGHTTNWFYRDGQAGEEGMPYARVSHPEFLFDPNKTPVAVLIGPQTASSGEATAISFRGRPNTRFFGQPSYGLTTGNEGFPLSDGAMIILTVAVELDRTGQEYGGSIIPDVVTSAAESDATDWLLSQAVCKQ